MRNVIVTGGSRGLGLAMVRRLAAADYRVIAVARTATEPLNAASRDASAGGGGEIVFRAADLSLTEGIPALVRAVRGEFGAIYGLVNNAGSGVGGVLGLMPDKEIDALVRLNSIAPMVLTKYVSRSMMTARCGRIINISSITASTGYRGLSVYSATKASLVGFTRSLARELGSLGITVNAVAPGFVATEMTEVLSESGRDSIMRRSALGRMAEPDDVARSVEFLMGDGARNITGTVLTVDAGATA